MSTQIDKFPSVLAEEIERIIQASLTITPEALTLLRAAQREALTNPKLPPGAGGCINGSMHAWEEVNRYKLWASNASGDPAPDDCPWTVEDACLICGDFRQRLVPALPNTKVSDGQKEER